MLDLLQQGFGAVFSFHILFLMVVGVAVGIVFGAVPGLSATMAVALCLPLTFTMGPQAGLSLLVALFIGATSGGLISAILLKIPGTPSSIATVFDGGPLMEQGHGVKALGVGIVFSFLGTIFSIVALMFIAPQLAKVALRFGPHEYFAIAIFSLTLIATLSAGSMAKGLFAGALGFAVSTVGIAPVEAVRRFTFGVTELNGGFAMLTVMIGMFAVAEIIKVAERGRTASQGKAQSVSMKNIKGFGFSLKEFREQVPNASRSGLIGLAIGILPGIGAGTSNLVAYIISKKRAKNPETYGKGNIGGIVASETANNAGIGGAMLPLMTLGIPGDTVTAILLGGFLIHGIQPGPLLFISQAPLVYTIFAALIVSTVLMLFMEFYGLRIFIKLLDVPKHILLPIILVLCVVGAFGLSSRLFDVWSILLFGLLGYAFVKAGMPAAPFIIGFILGPMAETNLRRGLMLSDGNFGAFLSNPIAASFLGLALAFIVWQIVSSLRPKKSMVSEILRT
ncbi:tripartite tricarboxylate transporter permease [Pseudomonas sp. 1928-m]|uniref:tripartite tricarboxylate transporter permease n=1 Tax=Pseudomonas sp. 1928-m TaxID=3033804 RepID=UPI0023DF0490|nr:tripartite tricarboxylate transporter permease [Pseudomonas sp. 1928-m]MDF3194145.1 tripartite tricarboxylate transporter permease [Pseudomonas sp. 1928-m]